LDRKEKSSPGMVCTAVDTVGEIHVPFTAPPTSRHSVDAMVLRTSESTDVEVDTEVDREKVVIVSNSVRVGIGVQAAMVGVRV
jgi:hypothetical protein